MRVEPLALIFLKQMLYLLDVCVLNFISKGDLFQIVISIKQRQLTPSRTSKMRKNLMI